MSITSYVEKLDIQKALLIIEDYKNFQKTGATQRNGPLRMAIEGSDINDTFWATNAQALVAEIAVHFVGKNN